MPSPTTPAAPRQVLSRPLTRRAVLGLGAAAGIAAATGLPAAPAAAEVRRPTPRPVVIGHRGASGHRPEHTLESYRVAIAMGADYVEPDLVSTKDGVLVARHENEISTTTDVADKPEFADRQRSKVIDGTTFTGWFTEDFTLAELRTLRAKERMPALRPGNTAYDGQFPIPTLTEVIDLVLAESRRLRRPIGIYPETKHPTYHRDIGLPLEEPLVATLRQYGLAHPRAKVCIQSFETGNLRRLRSMVAVSLVQLVNSSGAPYDLVLAGDPRTYDDLVTPDGLDWVASYADGIGTEKNRVITRTADGTLGAPTTLVADAHARRLFVHAWTFRTENLFLPAEFRTGTDPATWGNAPAEYAAFYRQGVDGVFSDFPDHAVAARMAAPA